MRTTLQVVFGFGLFGLLLSLLTCGWAVLPDGGLVGSLKLGTLDLYFRRYLIILCAWLVYMAGAMLREVQ